MATYGVLNVSVSCSPGSAGGSPGTVVPDHTAALMIIIESAVIIIVSVLMISAIAYVVMRVHIVWRAYYHDASHDKRIVAMGERYEGGSTGQAQASEGDETECLINSALTQGNSADSHNMSLPI
jgi:hypothetical protein